MLNEVDKQIYTAVYCLCQLKHHSQHNTNSLNIKVKEKAESDENFTLTQYESKLRKECKSQNLFIELTVKCKDEGVNSYSQNNVKDLSNQSEDLTYD